MSIRLIVLSNLCAVALIACTAEAPVKPKNETAPTAAAKPEATLNRARVESPNGDIAFNLN